MGVEGVADLISVDDELRDLKEQDQAGIEHAERLHRLAGGSSYLPLFVRIVCNNAHDANGKSNISITSKARTSRYCLVPMYLEDNA